MDIEPDTELGSFLIEQKEKAYKSKTREPLGKGYSRGHTLPADTQKPDFAFGVTSDKSMTPCPCFILAAFELLCCLLWCANTFLVI